jgi:hypothetical protein
VKVCVSNTNIYAHQKGRKLWRDTYDIELKAFIGVILYMGAKGIDRSHAWQDQPWGDEFLKSAMTFRRFTELFACLHFVDNETVTCDTQDADCFWRLRPLLDSLIKQFMASYVPGQYLSVDEITTAFKGRHRAKQCNKDKPSKWGFKSFALCCAATGYVIRLHPYMGRDQARPDGMSLGEFAVLSVLPERLNNKGHIICADNWFTSVHLIDTLLERGFHYCGTARQGRRGQPSKKLFALPSKSARGTFKVYLKVDSVVHATVWRDRKDVRFLSSFPSPAGTILRRPKGGAAKVPVICPALVALYNAHMGGVDRIDQGTSYVKPTLRSRRPSRPLIIHLILLTAYNARVLYALARGKEVSDVSMVAFTRKLCLELINPYVAQKRREASFVTPVRKWTKKRSPILERPVWPHFPVEVKSKDRRRCRMCTLREPPKRKDVRTHCKGCGPNTFLCLDGEDGGCWTEWHSREDRF